MKKSVISVLITMIIISIMYFYAPKEAENRTVYVTACLPSEKNISDYVNADGRIKEGKKRNIYLKKVSQIDEIFVKEGESVKCGQALFSVQTLSEEVFSEVGYTESNSGIYEVFKSYGFEIPDVSAFSYITEEERVITSPIDGVITDVNIACGENVNPIKKLMTVSDFSDLYIETMIPEAYSSKVHPGDEARISADAFDNKSFIGKIEEVDPVAKYIPAITGEGKTYINATIRPNSTNELFRPELTVKAKIAVNTIKGALTLPYECIRQDEDGKEYVYCIDDESIVFKQIIESGHELNDEIEVKKGITKTSRVIFDPTEEIKEGLKVTVRESEKNADS